MHWALPKSKVKHGAPFQMRAYKGSKKGSNHNDGANKIYEIYKILKSGEMSNRKLTLALNKPNAEAFPIQEAWDARFEPLRYKILEEHQGTVDEQAINALCYRLFGLMSVRMASIIRIFDLYDSGQLQDAVNTTSQDDPVLIPWETMEIVSEFIVRALYYGVQAYLWILDDHTANRKPYERPNRGVMTKKAKLENALESFNGKKFTAQELAESIGHKSKRVDDIRKFLNGKVQDGKLTLNKEGKSNFYKHN